MGRVAFLTSQQISTRTGREIPKLYNKVDNKDGVPLCKYSNTNEVKTNEVQTIID